MNKFTTRYNELLESLDEKTSIDIRQYKNAMDKIKQAQKTHKSVTLTAEEVEAMMGTFNKKHIKTYEDTDHE